MALNWDILGLQAQLRRMAPALTVQVLSRVASTNTALLEQAKQQPLSMPCLLVAEQQTQGRGRMGRHWYADSAHTALTFSLAWPMQASSGSGLSLAVGWCVAQALEPVFVPGQARIQLKWPNDLWLMSGGVGAKLGGILIETCALGQARLAVVGVGLNLRPQTPFGRQHACLQDYLPHMDAPAALHAIAEPLLKTLQRFNDEGFARIAPWYAQRDALVGRELMEPLVGTVQGVDSTGALLVRTPQGVQALEHGQIKLSSTVTFSGLCSD